MDQNVQTLSQSVLKSQKKIAKKYLCETCDYITSNKSDYNKHLETRKHLRTNLALAQKVATSAAFMCSKCDKSFQSKSGLWRHSQKCPVFDKMTPQITPQFLDKFYDIINEQKKSNEELQKNMIIQHTQLLNQNTQFMEELKNTCVTNTCSITNITKTNITNIKPTFNLNVFLNETCKDAMNLTEFVDNFKIDFNDFLKLETNGYVNGITDIIMKNLKALEVEKRPVHCTDSKRGTVYIKDNNAWEKENEDKMRLRSLIRKVSNKNIPLLPEFKKRYPECMKTTSKLSDKYSKLIIEVLGGSGDNEIEKENKIINKITKNVTIDKLQ
jgi:uncharacterized C2H2 Zn-finger protein